MGLFSAHFAALLLSVMLVVIKAEVHHYDFVLKEKNFTRLCSTKSMLVVNESIPGPVIRVHKGDTVYVNFQNQANYGLTIHWHGVMQPRNPWSDGDWFEVDVNYVIHEELKVGGFSMHEPNCSTFNSQPGDFHDCFKVDVHMDELTFFAIAGHNLTVIGTDGAHIKPIVASYIMMAPRQTMDILVTTNQSLGEYHMATRNYYSTTTVHPSHYTQINATAILQYRGNYNSSSLSFPSSILPYYTDYKAGIDFIPILIYGCKLKHCFMVGSYSKCIRCLLLNITGFYTTDFPDEPPTYCNFLKEYLGLNVTQSFMAAKVKLLDYNEEVEIVFQSTNVLNSAQNHPMHLHGHSFYVVGLGEGIFNSNEDPKGYNLIDPPYQNTAIVPKLGWFALRFRASNPGVWFMHCHIEHYYTYGMNTIFLVKNGGTPETSMQERPLNMPSSGSSSIHGIQKSKNSAKTLDKLNMI
ncbi:hypothetical protein SLE2022_116730 [Rubroshorea leprosula]